MSGLGQIKRNEQVRIQFMFQVAPTGTPTIVINKGGTPVLTSQPMVVVAGSSNKIWYYDYTTASDADPGVHQAIATAVIDGETQYAQKTYDQTINDIDAVKEDTETIIANLDISTGARAIVINIKDGDTNPVEGVSVGVYNSNNDSSPVFGLFSTDALGDTPEINLDDDTYKVRLSKPSGIVPETETIVVTADGTKELTVELVSITPPVNPDTSNCYIAVYDLAGNVVTSGVTLTISKKNDITKDANNNFLTSTTVDMVYHAGSGTWQAAIVKGTHVNIKSTKVFGINDNGALIDRDFIVGTGTTTNLGEIKIK